MKKTVLTALCAAFCLALCGCDNGENPSSNNGTNSSVSSSSDAGSSSSADSAESSDGENSGETAGVKSKAEKLLAEVEFPGMVEVTADKFAVYYGIEEADVSEYAAYICGSGAAPDEFGIFTAKDADAAERIKTALENRVKSQYDTFKDYTPDAMYRFDDDFVEVNGTTVIYAVCGNNEKAKEILK